MKQQAEQIAPRVQRSMLEAFSSLLMTLLFSARVQSALNGAALAEDATHSSPEEGAPSVRRPRRQRTRRAGSREGFMLLTGAGEGGVSSDGGGQQESLGKKNQDEDQDEDEDDDGDEDE